MRLILLFWANTTFAMDPFTAISVAGEVVGEAASVTESFTELYSEIDTSAQISEDGQKIINNVREIDSLYKEAGYTAEELDASGRPDSAEIKKMEGSLKALTRAIKAGKASVKLLLKLDKKAQLAEVESAQLEKEQLALMYRSVRLQEEARLESTKQELKEVISKKKQITTLREELRKKGVKVFGASGVLSYPKSARVIETSLEVAKKLKAPLLALTLIVFFARLIFYQFGFFGVKPMGDLVRDLILCSLLLMIYPEIVRAVLSYSSDLASSLGAAKLEELKPREFVLPTFSGGLTSFKVGALWVLEWIKYSSFSIIDFVMNFGMAFVVMLFPIVIFASQMMNFGAAWPMFLGGFVTLALWPLFWNLVGMAAQLSWGVEQKSFSESLYTLFFTLLQLVSPLIGMKLMSGQGIVKALGAGASMLAAPGVTTIKGFSEYGKGKEKAEMGGGFQMLGSNGMPSIGRMVGSARGVSQKNKNERESNSQDSKSQKISSHDNLGGLMGRAK